MSSLLSLLEKDFTGKTTVSDCLRSGRTLPVAEVRRALSDDAYKTKQIDKSVLHSSNALVLTVSASRAGAVTVSTGSGMTD